MSFNGSGTFNINTAGQPVVTGTVISSSVFNALTADLATGLSTCITKDGQTTVTANIPMNSFKFTGLAAGTAATDSVRLGQLQAGGSTLITVAGTNTYTGTMSPALASYAAGNTFTFVVPNTNTTACTLNIDGQGAKSITRDGTTALVAGDLVAGAEVVVVYDGTQFQVLNSNSKTNFNLSGTLTVAGNTTLSGGTANGVLYLNGSKVATSGSALTFDGTNLGIGTSSPSEKLAVNGRMIALATGSGYTVNPAGGVFGYYSSGTPTTYVQAPASGQIQFWGPSTTALATLDTSGNLGIGTSSPQKKFVVSNAGAVGMEWSPTDYTNNMRQLAYNRSTSAYVALRTEASQHEWYNGGTEAMRLDSSGNLLVGTTDAAINSGAGIKLKTGANNNVNIVASDSTNTTSNYNLYSTGAAAYRFYVGMGGTVYATSTTISAISDQRFKENIRDLDVGLNAVMALKPRIFDWKAGKGKDKKDDRGFIAQEFEQVFPDLIDEWKDPAPEGQEPYKSVRQDLIPVLVKAIQEQQTIINDLRARVSALESK